MGRIGRDDGEMRKAEVGHGPRDRPDVERIARGNENYVDAVALGLSEQDLIVVGLAMLKLQ